MRGRSLLLLAASLVTATAEAQHSGHGEPAAWTSSLSSLAEGAAIIPDLGVWHRDVGTSAPQAQAYFDQGLRLAYGFNHDEAARSFAKAASLAPTCAMCFWGIALTLGPNYNTPLLPDRSKLIWEALAKARSLADHAKPADRALIEALAARYAGPDPVAEQTPYDAAYANAMRKVATRFPEDLDVKTLFAEAMMDVHPWRLWKLGGQPEPGTEEVVTALEQVLSKEPRHPGANHYFIHAVEASPHPERAEAAADRLPSLIPAAGHIVHMPAHIYQRVGRYADAAQANRKAIEVDRAYLTKLHAPGYYGMYLGHNQGFLSYAAAMLGRSAESLAAAKAATEAIPEGMLDMMPGMDFIVAETTFVRVRFGLWQAILQDQVQATKYPVLAAIHLHGVAMAHASLGQAVKAKEALAQLDKLAASLPKTTMAGPSVNTARAIVAVAAMVARARIAEKQRAWPEAESRYRAAIALEDKLAYNEPADWFCPVRQLYGAALLDAGKAKEAEAVFVADLRRNPNNGWSLFGRWQALVKLGRGSDATEAKAAFDKAWSSADIALTRAAF